MGAGLAAFLRHAFARTPRAMAETETPEAIAASALLAEALIIWRKQNVKE